MRTLTATLTAVLLSAACSLTVTYPVCAYRYLSEQDWTAFEGATGDAVRRYFGSHTQYLLSSSKRTLTVIGPAGDHQRFVPWLTVEACVPSYGDSVERGAYVVCSAFMERAALSAIGYAEAGRDGKKPALGFSEILRDMDANSLGCQQKWPTP